MPEYWYSYRAIDNDDPKAELNRKIVAAYKPYFMTYVYPTLRSTYSEYVKSNDDDVRRKFRRYKIKTVNELKGLHHGGEDAESFLSHFHTDQKIGTNPCIVNRICKIFEGSFPNGLFSKKAIPDFDFSILKSGVEYSRQDYYSILDLYDDYQRDIDRYMQNFRLYGVEENPIASSREMLVRKFKMLALQICENEQELCDIVIDICYKSEKSKQFAWDVSGNVIIENLLKRNGYKISYPAHNEPGFTYQGESFSMKTLILDGGYLFGCSE